VNESLEYNLPKNAYINFDAVSLKDFIIQRLNENPKFTDQNYEGSNLSSLIDIIAYSYHVLLFYLNQTSSESLFTQASIYENMNKIVNLVGYKPTGKQTSLVPINCVADSLLPVGNYTIRKYSYFLIDKIQYTVLDDFSFEKVSTDDETIDTINNNLILYQGTVGEYPIYTAEGLDYETFPVVVDNRVDNNDDRFIAHNTLSIYVKETDTGTWKRYEEVDSLYLSEGKARICEVRLNENGNYEIKFGNDSFGRKLKIGDEVVVYYILSDNAKGIISKNAINGNKLFTFNSNKFNTIYNDTSNAEVNSIITGSNNSLLNFNNPANSTTISDPETVEEIKQNVPFLLGTNIRLVNEIDYEKFLGKTLSNVLNSIKVTNNKSFIEEYLDYFYKICVDPNKTNRVIMNQVNFADSCDFNNVNIFAAPKFTNTKDMQYPPFLNNSFKNLIVDVTNDKKMISHEIIPRDPVYVAFDVGFTNGAPYRDLYKTSKIKITRDSKSKINKETLKNKIVALIINFFDPKNNKLGQTINLSNLSSDILKLEGVNRITTINGLESFNGLSFISWNPVFENVDESLVTQTTTLPFFKFPYLFRPESIGESIEIVE
jgi:hypothetical protein